MVDNAEDEQPRILDKIRIRNRNEMADIHLQGGLWVERCVDSHGDRDMSHSNHHHA